MFFKPLLATSILFFGLTGFAAEKPFDCKVKSKATFSATVSQAGTMNRSVQVTFTSKPATAEATKIVQACIRTAAEVDATHDALGSAWIGESPLKLGGGTYFAYMSKTKSYKFM